MKKLIVCFGAALLLAGCGSSGKVTSKTCTVEESGFTMAITMDAKDDTVNKLSVQYTLSGVLAGQEEISEEEMKAAGNMILSGMGIKEGNGISAEFKADGEDLLATVSIDLEKVDDDTMKSIGMKSEMKNMKLSEIVKEAEEDGATCK